MKDKIALDGSQGEGSGEIRLSIKPFEKAKANKSWSFTGLGDYRGGRAVVSQVRRFLKTGAAVEEHLADQLLVPVAVLLGRSGTPEDIGIAIEKETLHYTTNRDVIGRFLC